VRDILIDCAGEYLPESKMQELIVRCQAADGKESGNYRKRQWLSRVESLVRQILDSILRRGRTNTYSHGVRYLKKLDRLSGSISDWRGFEDHRAYLEDLRRQHGRKSSFWGRYET